MRMISPLSISINRHSMPSSPYNLLLILLSISFTLFILCLIAVVDNDAGITIQWSLSLAATTSVSLLHIATRTVSTSIHAIQDSGVEVTEKDREDEGLNLNKYRILNDDKSNKLTYCNQKNGRYVYVDMFVSDTVSCFDEHLALLVPLFDIFSRHGLLKDTVKVTNQTNNNNNNNDSDDDQRSVILSVTPASSVSSKSKYSSGMGSAAILCEQYVNSNYNTLRQEFIDYMLCLYKSNSSDTNGKNRSNSNNNDGNGDDADNRAARLCISQKLEANPSLHSSINLEQCLTSNAIMLLDESYKTTYELEIDRVPSIFINGKRYCGDWNVNDLEQAMCDALSNDKTYSHLDISESSFPKASKYAADSSLHWRAPLSEIDKSTMKCSRGANPTKKDNTCLVSYGTPVAELIPIMIMLFLIFSGSLLICILVIKQRFRRNRVNRRYDTRRNELLEEARSAQRLNEVITLLAYLAENPLFGRPQEARVDTEKAMASLEIKKFNPSDFPSNPPNEKSDNLHPIPSIRNISVNIADNSTNNNNNNGGVEMVKVTSKVVDTGEHDNNKSLQLVLGDQYDSSSSLGDDKKEVSLPSSLPNESAENEQNQQGLVVDLSESRICSICLEHMEEGDEYYVLPHCKHIFHANPCMKTWGSQKNECPCCRKPLYDESMFPMAQSAASSSLGNNGNSNNRLQRNISADLDAELQRAHELFLTRLRDLQLQSASGVNVTIGYGRRDPSYRNRELDLV